MSVDPSPSAPEAPLRAILIEDSPADALLIEHTLRQGGVDVVLERVESAAAFEAALDGATWSAILSDFYVPGFGAIEALRILHDRGEDLPFIVVSGALGEERAVSVIRAGAHDFFAKDRMARLPAAVLGEIREAGARRALRRRTAVSEFFAAADHALVGSTDLEETARLAARAAVPFLAIQCAVGFLTPGGARRVVHAARECPVATMMVRQTMAVDAPHVSPLCDHDHVSLPLAARGRDLGAMVLCCPPGGAAPEIDVATKYSRRVASALLAAWLYRQADEALHARDQFLSIASHEVRTPLTALALQLQVANGLASEGPASEPLRKAVSAAARHLSRMIRLVDSLFEASALTSGMLSLSPDPLDLGDLVRTVTGDLRPVAARSGCELRVSVGGPVVGRWDRLRLEQALINLIANAIKFAPGRPIDVSLAEDRDRVTLQVTDRGMGISPEDLDRIFHLYERAAADRNYGGLGLGLYIARGVVEAHGGTLGAISRPGEGATFTITLPRAPPAG